MYISVYHLSKNLWGYDYKTIPNNLLKNNIRKKVRTKFFYANIYKYPLY